MNGMLKRLHREQAGITALETAIILIAFVVVAAVFAFTILSAGTFSTERGKEAVLSGLEEVRSALELKGGVIALGSGTVITEVRFTVSPVAGGLPIDLTEPPTNNVVVINYRDASQHVDDISNWSVTWLGYNDGDNLLEERELAQITVPLSGTLTTDLGANTDFAIEVQPPQGGVLKLERTTPAQIDAVMDLN